MQYKRQAVREVEKRLLCARVRVGVSGGALQHWQAQVLSLRLGREGMSQGSGAGRRAHVFLGKRLI